MQLLPDDEHFLQRALELAQEAAAFASPNPTVGCVLAREGKALGEGAHFYDNRDHAEIAALKQASANGHFVAGATAYVTLEPCSHHGRTGPCADALVTAGIARCVIATVDPNPMVSGSGVRKLQAAGVETVVLPATHALAQQARRLNDAFAFSVRHGRPFVTLKSAVSADGKLAPPSAQRNAVEPHWLTGRTAREDVQRLRHASDAVLTGIGTVLTDNPSLTDRTGLPRRRPLLRVVMDADLRIPLDSTLVSSAHDDLLVVTHMFAPEKAEAALRNKGVEVLRLSGEPSRPALDATLTHLQQNGIRSLMVEAGSQINSNLFLFEQVDRVVLYKADVTLGTMAVPFAQGGPTIEQVESKLLHVERCAFRNGETEDIRISGYLHDPWAEAGEKH